VGDVRAEYGANLQNRALIQVEYHGRRQRPAVETEREFAAGNGNKKRAGFGGHFGTHGRRFG
jgi:hypothetical protein